ncbi:hypothetical protein M9Y10_038448 [Tritrichomonas musculus]|uniref:Right handed beta helix domain-containing protein n=1 Tax=Tritrichomonas musculus TaxID=1915356 RepID=A0ABR2K8F2_9EUKA
MNITLLSLSISSFASLSPFIAYHNLCQGKFSAKIFDSHFTRSFTSVLYSNIIHHQTFLKNVEFKDMLNGAISFVKAEEDEIKNKLTIIKNKNITSTNHYDSIEKYGDLTIASCTFQNCQSEFGGGIFVEQNCSVILHELIFDGCFAQDGAGGYICQRRKERVGINNEIEDDYLRQVDVQYCCFQNCKVVNNDDKRTGFGSALIIASEKVVLFYASTVNCPGKGDGISKSRGAQFDIQSKNVSSQYVNATGGYSKYCGSIEYRKSSEGFFRFQTIMTMDCMFVIAFSKFEKDTIDISFCNLLNNTIHLYDSDAGSHPALIHVRQQNITINNFAFINNDFGDTGRIASKESQTTPDSYKSQKIILNNCYADSYVAKDTEAFETNNCDLNYAEITLNTISQLNLGECKGNIPPPEIVITSIFSPSFEFSKSDEFSNSKKFTKSDKFTSSDAFTKSHAFTPSGHFSRSNDFSASEEIPLVIPKEINEEKKISTGAIAGIVAGVVAAVAVLAVVAVFLIRKHKLNMIDKEDIETINSDQATTNTDNPIYNQNAADDPFKEDF